MIKKSKLIFIFTLLFFLAIGVASAADDNSTDIVQENLQNQPISISDPIEDGATDDSILESGNSENNLSSNIEKSEITKNTTSAKNNKAKSTKADLKITTNANFVKKGNKYYIYLTDKKGNAVANKKLKVVYNGKTYTKTTDSKGKVSVKVSLSDSSTTIKVSYAGDKKYNSVSKKINVYILKTLSVKIGNSKLLTNGYLRVYLKGTAKLISKKTVKIKIGNKTYTKNTTSEGFVIIKPDLSPGKYTISVTHKKLKIKKTINCIKGNVMNPLKKAVPLKNGVPDVDVMPKNFVMGDNDAKYTLKKSQYREAIKRDSYCLYLYNKLSKYTFFKTKKSPDTYHILKREKWNVIERTLNKKLVKKNKYNYWPETITASLKGKSYTYSEVRDVQNKGYTCGPTSASVCSQALRNYYSEKYFQTNGNCVDGINMPVLKKVIEENNFKCSYFWDGEVDNAVKQLKKGAALIVFLPNHYISIIDISPDGKKVLVSNSYGDYNVGCRNVPTNWVSVKYLKTKFAGVGLVVKLNYKLKDSVKKEVKNFYKSMGPGWKRQNTNERIPNT